MHTLTLDETTNEVGCEIPKPAEGEELMAASKVFLEITERLTSDDEWVGDMINSFDERESSSLTVKED